MNCPYCVAKSELHDELAENLTTGEPIPVQLLELVYQIKMKPKFLPFALLALLVTSFSIAYARKSPVRHHVNGYTKKDGTHVSSYTAGSRIPSSSGTEPDTPRSSYVLPIDPNTYDVQGNVIPKEKIDKQFTAICSGVTSGDTIEVMREGVNTPVAIYLFGVDAPEERQHFNETSTKNLSSIALNQRVSVFPKGYGRSGILKAWVFVGKACANTEQIKSGLAWYRQDEAPNETKLAQLEEAARKSLTGLWCEANSAEPPVAPWKWNG